MGYLVRESELVRPELPPWPRIAIAVVVAFAIPSALLVLVLGTFKPLELARVGALAASSAILIALPLGLFFWRRVRSTLLACLVIGALSAPGPLGYMWILILASSGDLTGLILAVGLLAGLAILGAFGGATFWIVVTRFGRDIEPEAA